MADNYLEKKYRDLFGDHTVINPETGFAERKNSGLKIPKPVQQKGADGTHPCPAARPGPSSESRVDADGFFYKNYFYLCSIVLFTAGFSGMRLLIPRCGGTLNLPNAPFSAGDKARLHSLCENGAPENRDTVRL